MQTVLIDECTLQPCMIFMIFQEKSFEGIESHFLKSTIPYFQLFLKLSHSLEK